MWDALASEYLHTSVTGLELLAQSVNNNHESVIPMQAHLELEGGQLWRAITQLVCVGF